MCFRCAPASGEDALPSFYVICKRRGNARGVLADPVVREADRFVEDGVIPIRVSGRLGFGHSFSQALILSFAKIHSYPLCALKHALSLSHDMKTGSADFGPSLFFPTVTHRFSSRLPVRLSVPTVV